MTMGSILRYRYNSLQPIMVHVRLQKSRIFILGGKLANWLVLTFLRGEVGTDMIIDLWELGCRQDFSEGAHKIKNHTHKPHPLFAIQN
jgi:hypothetical protein